MKVAYFDCFSGISGDMTLGALLDAGLPLSALQEGLASLHLPEFNLEVTKIQKCGISATTVRVHAQEGHVHRGLPEISEIIRQSDLPEAVQQTSLQVFSVLAVAEARIHGSTPEQVHFHEVGAVDAIVDIVGACFGLHYLGVEQIHCSALPTGGGQVRSAHGVIPVPAPATLALLAERNVPLYDNGQRIELVTPTGAALMVAVAHSFGSFPSIRPQAIGYGAGQKDLDVANVLRIVIGESVSGRPHVHQPSSHDHGQRHDHDVTTHQHAHDHRHEQVHAHQQLEDGPSSDETEAAHRQPEVG